MDHVQSKIGFVWSNPWMAGRFVHFFTLLIHNPDLHISRLDIVVVCEEKEREGGKKKGNRSFNNSFITSFRFVLQKVITANSGVACVAVLSITIIIRMDFTVKCDQIILDESQVPTSCY